MILRPLTYRQQVATTFVFGVAGWLCISPYIGVDHDARLYVLQALRWLHPDAFTRDLWFAHGSQDDFSLFSPYLAAFLSVFGISTGAIVTTLVQPLVFAAAALVLGHALLGRNVGLLAALALCSIPLIYSPGSTFRLTEGFVTARGLAIGLSLAGLALAVWRRPVWAALLLAAGLAMHPIMAFAPSCVAALLFMHRRGAWWWASLAATGALAGLLMAAYSGLVPTITGEWLHFVEGSPLVFIDNWPPERFLQLTLFFSVPLAAVLYGDPARQRFYCAVLLVGAAGIAVSAIASQIPIPLLLKVQFWRAVWLVQVVAVCGAVDLLWLHLLREGAGQRIPKLLYILLSVLLTKWQPAVAPALVLVPRLVPPAARLRAIAAIARVRPAVWGVAVAVLGFSAAVELWFALGYAGVAFWEGYVQYEVLRGFLRTGGYGLFALMAWYTVRQGGAWVAWPAALVTLAIASVFWDMRSEARVAREGMYRFFAAGEPGLAGTARGVVYWPRGGEQVWFALSANNYATGMQGIGTIFSEQRSLELARRFRRIFAAQKGNGDCRLSPHEIDKEFIDFVRQQEGFRVDSLPAYELHIQDRIGAAAMSTLCADPGLDYVVSTELVADLVPALIAPPISGSLITTRYVYACETVRERLKCKKSQD